MTNRRHKNKAPPAGWITRITCTDCAAQSEFEPGTRIGRSRPGTAQCGRPIRVPGSNSD